MTDFAQARRRMVERQVAARGIKDEAVLDAMRTVPRESFVPEHLREFAYDDAPLPIEADQTISQPYIVAMMIEAAGVAAGRRVLEIGAGSGYAAAVMAQTGAEVFAIERHPELAALAEKRLRELGYDKAVVRRADGSGGWTEMAAFDAILAAASGSHVPDALKSQLTVGGVLVMPIGEPHAVQSLVKVTRVDANAYCEEDLGPVRFVPLVGAYAWRDESGGRSDPLSIPDLIRGAAEPLPATDDPAFGALFDRFASARVVLLGEASHGTSDFYRARAAISKRLIDEHGFTIVAVEADWPDAANVDRYVRHRPRRDGEDAAFQRFPTWMWRNTDVDVFVRWLRARNERCDSEAMAGFHGLDLYNLGGSIRAVIDYLDDVDPPAAKVARERYGCLRPWSKDPAGYGRMAITQGFARCEQPVVQMLRELLQKRMAYAAEDGDEFLDAAANARLIKNAETYYRVMYHGAAESWNLRDTHMFETLCELLDARGPDAKAIVWAHNSHIGDASHTEMGQVRDELNIGQLCRERFGRDAVLIGMGTHKGTVAAASDWDGPMEIKAVQPSLADSYERFCHEAGVARFLLDLREGRNDAVRDMLWSPRLERFIGVIYRPETERWSHYAQAALPGQFDAWLWFDRSEAVTPLPGSTLDGEAETYPFGL